MAQSLSEVKWNAGGLGQSDIAALPQAQSLSEVKWNAGVGRAVRYRATDIGAVAE